MKNILIAGSTGMVGKLVLEECINATEIAAINVLARQPGSNHPSKVKEFVVNDFSTYANVDEAFKNIDAAFFCIGAYTGTLSKEMFQKVTVDFCCCFCKKTKGTKSGSNTLLVKRTGRRQNREVQGKFREVQGYGRKPNSRIGTGFFLFLSSRIYLSRCKAQRTQFSLSNVPTYLSINQGADGEKIPDQINRTGQSHVHCRTKGCGKRSA